MSERKKSGQTVNIFNFSFLDILACTVGALIFILVMVVLLNAFTASQSEIARRIQDLENKFAATKREAAEITRKKSRVQTELEDLESTVQIGREHADLTNELTRKKKEVEKLQQQILRKREEKIQIWLPREQKTRKMPTIPLVFQERRVAPMDEPFFKLVSKGESTGVARRLKKGETLREALLPRSSYSEMTQFYNKRMNYVPMVVYPSGFEIFRQMRDELLRKDWDYSLSLLPENAEIEYGGGPQAILR